jgi:RimJ/RimL family protein N-acetyltransferase
MTEPATAATMLETEHLQLRGFTDTEADAELLFELDSDPEVMRYIGPYGLPTVEAYRERLRTVWLPYYAPHSTRGFWAIANRASGQFHGWCFLRPATDYKFAAEVGWTRPSDFELGYPCAGPRGATGSRPRRQPRSSAAPSPILRSRASLPPLSCPTAPRRA